MQLKGSEIANRRERKGMSQKELAEAVGIDTASLSRYENGKVGNKPQGGRSGARLHPSIGVAIAQALGCDLEEIAVLAGSKPELPTEAA